MNKAILVGAVALASVPMSSTSEASQRFELPNVMTIAKSGNKNEVHYAAAVDERCAPASNAPLRPYWLMRERGSNVTEELSSGERKLVGIASQEVSGDAIRFVVNGLKSRTFVARLGRAPDGKCTSSVDTTIGGAPARLLSVYVKQKFFGVDYVLLIGRSEDGRTVQERMNP